MDSTSTFSFAMPYSPLYYDEERKRFVRVTNMNAQLRRRLFPSYTTQRPDLYGMEGEAFFGYPVFVWRILHTFQKIRSYHYNQLFGTYRTIPTYKTIELQEDFLMHRDFADLPVGVMRLWHWDDHTRMYHWMQLNLNRLAEYGMNIPLSYTPGITKEDMQQKEDELTDYFVEEMSKRPKTMAL